MHAIRLRNLSRAFRDFVHTTFIVDLCLMIPFHGTIIKIVRTKGLTSWTIALLSLMLPTSYTWTQTPKVDSADVHQSRSGSKKMPRSAKNLHAATTYFINNSWIW
jgi:hypothetical protein